MNIFSTIYQTVLYDPLFNALVFLYNTVAFRNMGVAIILLTLVIRFALYPVSRKAIQTQRAMQKMQPAINEIREKYKNDKEAQSREMMKVYAEHKMNPLSSCLPLIVQAVLLIALYHVFESGLNSAGFEHLYPFVTNPGHIDTTFLGFIDLAARGNIALAILAGGLQFIQSWMLLRKQKKASALTPKAEATKKSPEEMSQTLSRNMAYLFPFMTIYFGYALPAGLPLYWIVTTLFAIAQQWLLERADKRKEAKQKPAEPAATA